MLPSLLLAYRYGFELGGFMLIVAVAWIYVVLMMSLTEHSVIAGIMTFLLYGILPLGVILYLIATPERKRRRQAAEKLTRESSAPTQPQNDITRES